MPLQRTESAIARERLAKLQLPKAKASSRDEDDLPEIQKTPHEVDADFTAILFEQVGSSTMHIIASFSAICILFLFLNSFQTKDDNPRASD